MLGGFGNNRVIKLNGEVNFKAMMRLKFGPFVTIFYPHVLFNADKFLRLALLSHTGFQ